MGIGIACMCVCVCGKQEGGGYHLALDSPEDEWSRHSDLPRRGDLCVLCLSGSHFSPKAPADGFARLRSPSPSLVPRFTTPKATAHSRAGVEAPEPPSVLAGPWAPALLAPPAGDLCNTFPGLHFPADWKQSHCWFSPKKDLFGSAIALNYMVAWEARPCCK